MSKWILMPDSFKGTMSSLEICQLMREALLRHVPDAEVVSIPVADGGEGSVEAFLAAMGGHRVEVPCTGPDFRKISGFYGLLADGYTAVIEMAAAAGLPLMEGRLCAEGATTYGVGELILAAIRDGARRIILGLGGSATNDGGCGCAAALGVRFLDGTGAEYVPVGGTLDRLCRIDMSHRSPLLNGVEIVTMCDVDNPLCGPNGASAVFGPQKGADPDMVTRLDRNLRHLSEVIRQDLGREIADSAWQLARSCWSMDSPVRALTVTALYLLPAEEAGTQLDLFGGQEQEKRERLEKLAGAMDAIRAKYGKGAIAPASCPRDPGEERHAPPPGGKDYLSE